MPIIQSTVSCPIQNSFRVQQIAGLFDVPLAERATESFSVELPALDEPWQIGVIVGPSGSGKSTIAKAAFGDAVYQQQAWPADRAVIDCLGDAPTKQLAAMLTAVGFSSPPSWIKPYWALSNGERFRCDLARALIGGPGKGDRGPDGKALVVFDEFSSVVDRTVAKIGSAAVSKTVRRSSIPVPGPPSQVPSSRFIAVTCHYDVVPWLEPDWVLDMASGELARRRLRRPGVQLAVVRCRRSLWKTFERHHYLSGQLASGASCYAAIWNDRRAEQATRRSAAVGAHPAAGGTALSLVPPYAGHPVAFCATVGLYGRVGRKRITRIVVLPDYQGLGIGMQLAEHVAAYEASRGFRCNLTASHPAVIAHCQRSAKWQAIGIKRAPGRSFQTSHGGEVKTAVGRSVVSFEFVSDSAPHPQPLSPEYRGEGSPTY